MVPSRSSRIVGIDVARCVALVGMMATHILPGVVEGEVTLVQSLAGGRASALFAVLAGVSLTLVAGTSRPLLGRPWWGFAAGLVVRSVLVGALGLALGDLPSGIAVILAYYAVLFVVATPFLRVSTTALAWTAAAWCVLAPVASHLLRPHLPERTFEVPSTDSLEAPAALLADLLVTGYYPVLTWVTYVLAGLLMGRLDLRETRAAMVLVGGGAALMVAARSASMALLETPGARAALARTSEADDLDLALDYGLYGTTPTGSWWWLAVDAPHAGTPLDLLGGIGSAAAVLGVALLLGHAAPRLAQVAFGAGAMTLTLYSLHVIARAEWLWDGDDLRTFLGQVAVALLVGAVFALVGWRGPAEAVVGWASRLARRVVGGRR